MAARTLPNLGLKAFFSFGEDGWNNEVDQNFLKLSVLTQGGALDIIATKPLSPAEGAIYVISGTAISNPNTIAVYDAGAWKHFAPNAGWTIYLRSIDSYVVWSGTEWRTMALKNLRALGGLDATPGVIEQTGNATFTKRAIGASSDTDVLTRLAGDGRYALTGHTHPVTGVTAFNSRSGPVTLSAGDVQSALGFLPATASSILTSLSALGNSTIGLIEQTGPNAFSKRAIGTSAPSDVPTLSMADQRYQPVNASLTGLTNIPVSEFGVIEQFGNRTFRVRPIGLTNSTDLLTRGSADTLYLGIGSQAATPQATVKTVTDNVTLLAADAGSNIRAFHSSGVAITVPAQADADIPVGTAITIVQTGTGGVTINPDKGVIVDFLAGTANKTSGQHAVVTLFKYQPDAWTLSGNLVAASASHTVDTIALRADSNSMTADAV